MKKYNVLIVLLIISVTTYSQKIKYGISGGVNYSYVYNTEINKKQEAPLFFGPYVSTTEDIIIDNYRNFTENVKYTPNGKIGFLIDATAIFPINKNLSLKIGLGINMNNINFQAESNITGDMVSIIIDTNNNDTTVILNDVDDVAESMWYPDYNKTKISRIERKTFFLKIPLHLQINILKNKLFISSGMSIYKKLSSNYHVDPENSFSVNPLSINDVFINFSIGVEYNLFKNIFLGYNFEPNFQNMTNPITDYSYGNIGLPLSNMSFSISYKF